MSGEKIGDYIVERTLGSGSNGKVKLARHFETGIFVAIKIIKKAQIDQKSDQMKKVQREVAIMKTFKHSHLLKLIEIYESNHHIYLILEYAANGELFDYLKSRHHLDESEAMKFFRQIIYGLDFLHAHGVCHRDLKPENLLLDLNNNIKIADFGFARWMKNGRTESYCGSYHYAAPEIVRLEPYEGRAADIWSCGVLLFTLLSGRTPFSDNAVRKLLDKIKVGHFDMPDSFSDGAKRLIFGMLQVEPAHRITIQQIKTDPFFRLDLPQIYTLPEPIPIPIISTPIDETEITAQTKSTLMQLGFESEEELAAELGSNTHSMVKVFYRMLSSEITFEALPWPEENGMLPIEFDDSIYRVAGHTFSSHLHTDSYGRKKKSNFGVSPSVEHSLMERARWSPTPKEDFPSEVVQPIINIQMNLEDLVSCLQQLLIQIGFDWFHPDDFTIIARRQIDYLYMHITFEYEENSWLRMNLKFVNADMNSVSQLIEEVNKMLSQSC